MTGPIQLRAIGLIAPGMPDWASAAAILCGEVQYQTAPLPQLTASLLPPNERRRATLPTRLALEVAQQATRAGGAEPSGLASVFASADGDLDLIDRICRCLAESPETLSPTLFHNSVHNAAAGYWSIATHCMAPSTSLAVGDGTFAAGLIECATQLGGDRREILLVAYDLPGPPPLAEHRPLACPFACALLLGLDPGPPHLATLELDLVAPSAPVAETALPADLEHMRRGNPAARVLPLLQLLAQRRCGRLQLEYLDGLALAVELVSADHAAV